jgi:lincosamide nucleotidyltransferase A/C/D/E
MITARDALSILAALARGAVPAWVDGGWGVDALLGEQTRDHEDLDLVIALSDADNACEALSALGFVLTEDERPTRFVLSDSAGRHVDFHTVAFDAEGGGVQQLQDGRSYRYPPEGFAGRGIIGDRKVPCLTPEVQLECHVGYEPTETDRHDVRLLAARFGLPLPREYRD